MLFDTVYYEALDLNSTDTHRDISRRLCFPRRKELMYSNEGRRSWPSIIVDILQVTSTPSNKMRIMYKSNLNFERFNKYFGDMLRKGFIKEMNGANGRSLYATTERGKDLLGVLQSAIELVSSDNP